MVVLLEQTVNEALLLTTAIFMFRKFLLLLSCCVVTFTYNSEMVNYKLKRQLFERPFIWKSLEKPNAIS